MKIEFNAMEDTVLKNFNGGEGQLVTKMFNDGKCKIMRGLLAPGCTVGMHAHSPNCEVVFMTAGNAKMLYDDTVEYLAPGDCFYCPQGHSHSFINESDTDVVFYAVVPQHDLGA